MNVSSDMQMIIDLLITQAKMFEVLPMQRELDGLQRADSVATILDPTLYRDYLYSGKGPHIKRILQAGVNFQREVLSAAQDLLDLQEKKALRKGSGDAA